MKKKNKISSNTINSEEEIEVETVTSKRNVFCWAMYDLANTIYSMVIVSLIISRYILVIGQLEHGFTYGETYLISGLLTSIMQVGVAICVPLIGAISDTAGKRKPFVLSLTGIILLSASLLGFFHNLAIVILFFVISNVTYQFSLTFYDAMLPFIAKKEDIGKVAGFGVAWGYLGTIISLVIVLPLTFLWGNVNSDPSQGSIDYGYTNYWISFVIPMVLFFVFAIPFAYVREKQKKKKMDPIGLIIKNAYRQVKATIKDIRNHKPMLIFIIGYFFVVDAANVIVLNMMTLVTDGLVVGLEPGKSSDIIGILFIIISTMSAVIFTYFVGKFGEKYGGKNTFYLIGFLWALSLFIGIICIFTTPYILVGFNLPFILTLLIGIIAGPALGGTWTAQRIMITELAPKEKFGEYFGFSKLSGKASSAIGPMIFGAILYNYDIIGRASYAWALISVGIMMVLGTIIIYFVNPKKS